MGGDVTRIAINPSRPNRVEPRVRKRRPKQYPLMKEPRPSSANGSVPKELRLESTPFSGCPLKKPLASSRSAGSAADPFPEAAWLAQIAGEVKNDPFRRDPGGKTIADGVVEGESQA